MPNDAEVEPELLRAIVWMELLRVMSTVPKLNCGTLRLTATPLLLPVSIT